MSCLSEIKEGFLSRFQGTKWEKPAQLLVHPLFWILFITWAVFGFSSSLYYTLPLDTYEYISFDENLFHGETDARRTPLYPWFIKTFQTVTGEELKLNSNGGTETRVFTSGLFTARYVIWGQMIIFSVALALFYFTCRRLIQNEWILFALVLFTGIGLINYPRWISTESLSISFVMIFFWLIVSYLLDYKAWTAGTLGLWVFLMSMLRPVFLYIMILLSLFWLLQLLIVPHRKAAFCGLISSGLAWGLIFGYCELNERNNQCFGLSTVGTDNQMSRIICTGFYKKGTDPELNEFIANMNPDASVPMQGRIYWPMVEKFGFPRVQKYASSTVKKNLVPYGICCLKLMWWAGYKRYWNLCYFVGIIDLLFTLFLWVKLRKFPWIRLVCWGLFYGLMTGIYINTTCDYDRLISPCLPIIYLIGARYLDLLSSSSSISKVAITNFLKETL